MISVASLFSQMTTADFQYLTLVQCRLLKYWWGVSKFSSNTHLLRESGWVDAGEILQNYICSNTPLPSLTRDDIESPPSVTQLRGALRKKMGRWIGTAFHNLWCSDSRCYHLSDACSCKLCGNYQDLTRQHLLVCLWVSVDLDVRGKMALIERILYAIINKHKK